MTSQFRRRDLPLLLGALGTPAAAAAQPARPQPARQPPMPAVTRLPPMPCLDRPGDLASLLLEGSGAPAGTVVTFGHAFKPGDLPRGALIAARLADGRPAAAQLDVNRRHPDGSARIAAISIAAPAIGNGQQLGVVLARREGEGAEAALDPADILQGRALTLEIAPQGDGQPWRVDLVALLRAVPAAQRWQSGPLASQARVQARAQLGDVTSLRVVADVAVRADRSVWVDLWLRNDIAMQPGGGDAAYTATLALDGRNMLQHEVARHWHYSAWGRLVGGAAPEPPRVIHNPLHLAPSGAIMPYDVSVGVETFILEHLSRPLANPDWDKPLHPRGLQTSMGAPGARPDLGQTTNWIAAWLMTGDARMAKMSIGHAEAGGGIPWHFWDIRGGTDGTGGWLDVRRWPGFWTDGRGGAPPRGLMQRAPINTAWQRGATPSHQPNLSFVPYLLTGRRAFFDNLMAQSCWNVSGVWPNPRRGEGAVNDVLIAKGRQGRSAAWSLRQVDEAAWAAPDNDPNLAYMEEVTSLNWAWLKARIPEWTREQGEIHGYLVGLNHGYIPNIAPWQQDYFASTAANAARRGREDARVFLDWMRNFLVGRFFATQQGFTRNDAVAYQWAISPEPLPRAPTPPAPTFQTWAELAEATRQRNLSNGDGWLRSNGEYPRLGMLTLALIAHVFDDPRAKEAWQWLANSDSPNVRLTSFIRAPYQTVAPPGLWRVPEHAPRCTATGRR